MPGPAFEWPETEQCPNCPCCFAELCQRGAARVKECKGCVRPEYRARVWGCPCSSRLTRGTAAWRAERIRATVRATECPLPPCVEVVLRALAQGEVSSDRQALALLRVGGFVAEPADEVFTITEVGEVYLNARSDLRLPACLEVLAVDKTARLAQVVVGAWDSTRPVPVLLDQLTEATGLAAEELPGVWLDAEANCHAQEPDDLVLTKVRVSQPLPVGFMDGDEETVALRAVASGGGEQA
ncbi:hypothetical protein [Streptomyces sp. OK228]|uniref:hypothetical protein n=1 Tax=Streptomyces sp. OK228 TaxID=1882786 RepID=UPI000BC5392C|nr:hypothetical protein [Streptomyces sp. OK228]SOE31695.1 hypothetical protein SAMN05442782_8625 [Streptomyces sp. OK228]